MSHMKGESGLMQGKGNAKLIDALNDLLAAELAGINQYFVHAKICEHWGYKRLADRRRAEAISEMRHTESLITRILYLQGVPEMQRIAEQVNIGQTPSAQLQLDLDLENCNDARIRAAIALAVELHDQGTQRLLEDMLQAEEEHLQWLEEQLSMIKQVGEPNYLAQQIHLK